MCEHCRMSTPSTGSTVATLDPAATMAAVEALAVIRWWQLTGFVEVRGAGAVTFLDGTCTQAVASIEPGTARMGCFLDGRARIVAACLLHRDADVAAPDGATEQRLLLATTRDRVDELARHLGRYRLRARVHIEAVDLATISVVGAGAATLPECAGPGWYDAPSWGPHAVRAFVGSRDEAATLVRYVLPAAGVECADCDALEALRIDAGRPSVHDLLVGRMPAEVGAMTDAVALDKGCYLGQEPVARLHYRGRANRTLRRADLSGPVPGSVRASAGTLRASTAVPAPRAGEPGTAAAMPADGAPGATGGSEAVRAVHDSLLDPLALVPVGDAAPRRAAGQLTTWARRADGSWTSFAVVRRELEAGEQLALLHAPETVATLVDDADSHGIHRGR